MIANLASDDITSWEPDWSTGDDFLPPPSGPGPAMSAGDHPFIPNGAGQPNYRIADLFNPILRPRVVEQMKTANDAVLAGNVPSIRRERCWPVGVPAYDVYTRVERYYFVQTPKEVTISEQLDHQVRHIRMNVPQLKNSSHSWYGESVGHYEGGELVIDTIGLNDKTFVDNYRTPHTGQIHVVERSKLIDGGKTLQALITVEDPGAFTTPWSAVQRWQSIHDGAR